MVSEVSDGAKLLVQDHVPFALDPMGDIYLRGRASRAMRRGRVPWWILIAGWVLVGVIVLPFGLLAIAGLVFTLRDFSFTQTHLVLLLGNGVLLAGVITL